MEFHQVIGIAAMFITVPFIFAVVWVVDKFKPKDLGERVVYDKKGNCIPAWELEDDWGYKTKMALISRVFRRFLGSGLSDFNVVVWLGLTQTPSEIRRPSPSK